MTATPTTPRYALKKSIGLTITTTMNYSRRAMGYLWDRRTELDPQQVGILETLYNGRKKKASLSEAASFTSTYKLSTSKAGKLGYGRLWGSKGSLEKLERECRGTLCRDFYYDVDIVNAHPVLLLQFAKRNYNTDLRELRYYVDNRDLVLPKVADIRDDAKKDVLKALNNGSPSADCLHPLRNEISKFTRVLMEDTEYADLKDAVKNEPNTCGAFLSQLLQTIERDVMLVMKASLESRGWSADVLAYDGLMIRKTQSNNLEGHLRQAEADILEKTGFDVKIVSKPFEYFELPPVKEEIVPGVPLADYQTMKADFEMNHFYFEPTNTYGVFDNDELSFLELSHASELLQTKWRFKTGSGFKDYEEFFPLWREDPARRSIKTIDFKESEDPSVFVRPLNFAYQKATAAPNQEAVALFKQLIEINTNNNPILGDYVTKYFAHMLQRPFELPKVSLVFSGDKGTGKDTLTDCFIQYVVGNTYGINYQSNKQFFSDYDVGRAGKFLVKLEEADRAICIKESSYLKSLITSEKSMFNPKGKTAYALPNYNRIIFTTNKVNPFDMNDGERRFVILMCSSAMKGNFAFWKKVRDVLFTEAGGRAIAEYLLGIDLADFNVFALPENEYQNQIVNSEKTAEEQFVEQWEGEKASSADLFKLYRSYCIENDLPHLRDSMILGRVLLKFVRSGTLNTKRGSGNKNYYWKGANQDETD